MINHLRRISTGELTWIHCIKPREMEIQYLREHFSFHPLDLEDALAVNQRPKIDVYQDYLFLILLFPYYDRSQRKILASETNFFIGANYLVTISDGNNQVLDQFFDECIRSQVLREKYLSLGTPFLVYECLRRLQEGILPMLDHVSEDVSRIETRIFGGVERTMVSEILLIKRNIVNFRRVTSVHKNTLKKLLEVRNADFFAPGPELKLYFHNIIDRTKEIWETLENQKETIDALQETNDALISFKLNEIMKLLTTISLSIFSATLVATLFASNFEASTPFLSSPYGFWLMCVLVGAVMGGSLYYFKRKRWL